MSNENKMVICEAVLSYGLSLPNTYHDAPFHDENWQLVRFRKNKKVFLWTYERDGKRMIAESYDLITMGKR